MESLSLFSHLPMDEYFLRLSIDLKAKFLLLFSDQNPISHVLPLNPILVN